ncbi:MAG TPA: hypothetical protein DCR61_14355 [Verrucomicrobiales bacterium]|nr:hypothetical protein [Verrucomicrobiales bacterium]
MNHEKNWKSRYCSGYFYAKVLPDERIEHFFEGLDIKRQPGHQKAFLTYALGGVSSYSGKTMQTSHKDLVEK